MKFWQQARKAINSLNKFKVILLYRLLCFCIGFIVNHSSFVSCFGVRGSVWSRTKASQEKESAHLPPNSLSSEYVEDAGDTSQLLPPKLCRHWVSLLQRGIRAKHRWSTNASTLSVSVFVFVRVYACLCFCPFMCLLHLKYTYLSTFVCVWVHYALCLAWGCSLYGHFRL